MTPGERARDIAERLVRFDAIPSRAAVNYVAGEIEAAIRAALAEARDEEIRNNRERLREWLAEHGVQPVKGESMLWTGWYAALAAEREACARLAEANTRYRDCGVQEEIAAAIRARTPR